MVTDDTKTYLYLDPGRYVRQAVSLWDPNVALGTVTHENIGYLLPMGPFYWVLAELHVPLWIAQRLWMGAILFAAGAGVLYLCRTMGLTGPGRYVAALAFILTPYVLQYSGRISVILLPWAGSALDGGLRHPGPPPGRLALPGPLRPGGRPGQRHQRQLDPLRGHRPGPLAPLRRRGRQGGHLAPGLGGGLAGRAPHRAGLAVVGGRAPGGGGLRGQRPQVHRDRPRHQRHLAGLGDPPGAGLLVLLRDRPGRALDPVARWPTPRTCG